jgi:hypothetical protein
MPIPALRATRPVGDECRNKTARIARADIFVRTTVYLFCTTTIGFVADTLACPPNGNPVGVWPVITTLDLSTFATPFAYQ